jgi:hypothetical protein
VAFLAGDDERDRDPVILDHLLADLADRALAHAQDIVDPAFLQRRDGGSADHAAIGDDAGLLDAETLL